MGTGRMWDSPGLAEITHTQKLASLVAVEVDFKVHLLASDLQLCLHFTQESVCFMRPIFVNPE